MFSAPPNGELYVFVVFYGNIIQGITMLLRPVLVYISSRAVLLSLLRQALGNKILPLLLCFFFFSCSFCGAGGEESVFIVINDPLRDLTYCSLKF